MSAGKLPIVPVAKASDLEGRLWISPKSRTLQPDDPADSRWPSREIIARAAPGLADIINRQASPRRQFAHVKLSGLKLDLNAEERAELEVEEARMVAKLARPVEKLTRKKELDRHRDVLWLQEVRCRLGHPFVLYSHKANRPGPKRRHWQNHDYLKALGKEARAVLMAEGAPAALSAGGQPDGVVARFLCIAVEWLFLGSLVDAVAPKKTRVRTVKPEMIADIINRYPRRKH